MTLRRMDKSKQAFIQWQKLLGGGVGIGEAQ